MEAALLLYGDTERNAALRHELPIVVIDPFLFGLVDGRAHVMVSALERERVAEALPDAELHDVRDLGFYELIDGELSRDAVTLELASRAAAAMGVREAIVDPDFPVAIADRLRADGIELTPRRGDGRATGGARRRPPSWPAFAAPSARPRPAWRPRRPRSPPPSPTASRCGRRMAR